MGTNLLVHRTVDLTNYYIYKWIWVDVSLGECTMRLRHLRFVYIHIHLMAIFDVSFSGNVSRQFVCLPLLGIYSYKCIYTISQLLQHVLSPVSEWFVVVVVVLLMFWFVFVFDFSIREGWETRTISICIEYFILTNYIFHMPLIPNLREKNAFLVIFVASIHSQYFIEINWQRCNLFANVIFYMHWRCEQECMLWRKPRNAYAGRKHNWFFDAQHAKKTNCCICISFSF